MIASGKLDHSGSGNMSSHVATTLDIDDLVFGTMNHQCRNPDRWKNATDVNLAVHPHQRGHRSRAGAEAFVAAPPLLEDCVVGAGRCKSLDAAAGAPGFLDIAEKVCQRFFSRKPVGEARKAPVKRECPATVGVGRGKQYG